MYKNIQGVCPVIKVAKFLSNTVGTNKDTKSCEQSRKDKGANNEI